MRNVYFLLCALLTVFFFQINASAQGSCADGAYQWSDVATIFQNNGCASASCHGGGASGLDLTTFAGFNTGGTKCETEISSGTTLVDIIQIGGVACTNGTVTNAMNNLIANPMSATDIAAIQAYIDEGSFEFCAGTPLDDGICVPSSTIGNFADPGITTICSDGSDAPAFPLPTASLPDVQIVVEVNSTITTISDDGSFDTSTLMEGDEVCYTAFTFDLAAINELLTTASLLCPILDCDVTFGIPGVNQAIADLVAGVNDGVPGLNDLQEALDFAGSFGNPIASVQTAGSTLDALNAQIGTLLGNVCYASSEAVCLSVISCGPNTCPLVILNDANLPNLPPAVCTDDNLSLCFDVNVDEATFDPALVQFNYNLTIAGAPSTVTLNTTYISGGGIDPAASGQLCFETVVPTGDDPCSPYELSLEILSVFYNDPDCPDNFVAFDLNLTTPLEVMQTGDNLNDLIPLLTIAGLNPILVQIFPNPNWTGAITLPACDGTSNGTIEILAADFSTVCETLNVGIAGMDGCPSTDGLLPETIYENYTTYIDADGNEQPNPCAVNISISEQIIPCEDQCVDCPNVTNIIPGDNFCPDNTMLTFCFDFDGQVDENIILTVEFGGPAFDGSAGGTQICVEVPNTPPVDLCSSSNIQFEIYVICDGDSQPLGGVGFNLPAITDPSCGGITGCTIPTANNYNPNADCDDGSCMFDMCEDPCAPNFGAPEVCDSYDMTCNTDCLMGDIEIWDPVNCNCVVDTIVVVGCTDSMANNYDPNANCDDGSCIFSNPGCTDPCANNYDPTADLDDGSCNPYDMTCNTDCLMGDIEIWDSVSCICVVDTIVVVGCTDSMANNYDPNANCDDGSCIFSNPGCTDPCADNYDPTADLDDGSCNPYDMTCNTDCLMGDIEIWDSVNCICVVDTIVVVGCTNSMANNYDSNANCDDGSCIFSNPGCTDPCADNYDPTADLDDGSCNPYDMTCNDDCSIGPFGGSWDSASCSCINQITPINGCTEETASNYDPAANCDDGSCFCEEAIIGGIVVPDEGCDVSGLEIMIMAPDGTSITVTTDANGSFTVPGGPFPCGIYAATITDANVPACFTESGNIGPIQFEVDGQGNGNDGPFFIANPAVPTLSQWGLMILALLMMTFGALKISSTSTTLSFNLKK